MSYQDKFLEQVAYFRSRYKMVARFSLVSERPIFLRDHGEDSDRRCRFCGRGVPTVTFKANAHTIPEFLGNRSVFSLNECDACNEYFGTGCEDHLSKQTLLIRTLTRIRRKKRKGSTFKSDDGKLRIEWDGSDLSMQVPYPNSVNDLLVNGKFPEEIELAGNTSSQPYIPIEAAKALVKVACSVCPPQDLEQCRTAINWLMGRIHLEFSQFPVMYSFTPGWINDKANEVLMLRRKDIGAEPYLWCVVQFRNSRFQVFVPGCPADKHWTGEGKGEFKHFPSRFGPEWPFGPTVFGWGDWSGPNPIRGSARVVHRIFEATEVTEPN